MRSEVPRYSGNLNNRTTISGEIQLREESSSPMQEEKTYQFQCLLSVECVAQNPSIPTRLLYHPSTHERRRKSGMFAV